MSNNQTIIKTRQAWLEEPGRFKIREIEISPEPDEVLMKVAYCGLCNWELNHWKGLIGPYPQPVGHETCGTVYAVGSKVPEGLFKPGDKVTSFALAGFADYAKANYKACVRIANNVPLDNAIGEPLSCAVNTMRGVAPEVGDFGVIVGCGPMGLWCIQALSGNQLSALIAVDISDEKLELAKKYGATHTVNPKSQDVTEFLKKLTNGHMADFVIEGTGIPKLLNSCVPYLRVGRGRLAMMSSHEEGNVTFDWRPAMAKGCQILVTHPPYAIDMNDHMRRVGALINRGTFNVKSLITHRFPLEQIETAFKTLEHKPKDYIKGVVELAP